MENKIFIKEYKGCKIYYCTVKNEFCTNIYENYGELELQQVEKDIDNHLFRNFATKYIEENDLIHRPYSHLGHYSRYLKEPYDVGKFRIDSNGVFCDKKKYANELKVLSDLLTLLKDTHKQIDELNMKVESIGNAWETVVLTIDKIGIDDLRKIFEQNENHEQTI